MLRVSHQTVSDYYRNSIALLFLGFLERRRKDEFRTSPCSSLLQRALAHQQIRMKHFIKKVLLSS